MRIKFTISGESPEIGKFTANEEREIHDDIAGIFINRRMAVEVKEVKPAPAKAAVKKEDKDNGGD